jgi:hypothetical protein
MDKKPDFDQYLRPKVASTRDKPQADTAWDEHGRLAKSNVTNAHYFYDYGVRNKDQSSIDRAMRHAEKAKKYAQSYDDLMKSDRPKEYFKKEEVEIIEATDKNEKPKSMISQAREDLKKTKELYKKVDAVSNEMKNPGYNVNDRINHFRIKKHLHDIYKKKRQTIASKAQNTNEEVELVEAGQDRQFHEFWADRTSRQISLLKKKGRPVPDNLRMKYQKHRQALQKIRSGKETQVAAEGVDFATAKSDRGNYKTYTKYGPDGRIKLIKRREPRGEIKIGEAIGKENMMQDSIDKLKSDPLVSKVKIKLPPSQGVKPVGGEDQVHANMAEEKLNRLYESLSEQNKLKFMEKLETEEGFDQLVRFAEEQGF